MTLPENVHLRRFVFLVYGIIAISAVWLFIKFALVWLLPFIIAFFISRLIEPAVRFLNEKIKMKRGAASGLLTLVTFAVIAALTAALVERVIYELSAFSRKMPALLSELTSFISSLREQIDFFIVTAPLPTQDFMYGALDGFAEKSAVFFAALSGKLLSVLTAAASFSPKLIIFIFTCAVGTFFISSGYKEVTSFLLRQLPRKHRGAALGLKSDLFAVLGKWVKAELILSCVTFCQLLAAFFLMRLEYAIVAALIIAVIDILPLLGVGSVLVPWALIAVMGGDFKRAVTLVAAYVTIAVVRNVLEPKIVGAQLGLPPIATLLALYIGFCAAGVIGMMLFPIGLIMLKQLNDREVIRLWKR